MEALEKLQKLQAELNGIVTERPAEIEGALVALVAGQHVLLLGPPGTAKSMLANMVCKAIEGGEYFQWLLTKHSTPEELFGPLSLKALKEDTYKRNVKDKLPEAHIAFLDEIFKANSAILNALLTTINERKFHNNGKPIDLPLITVFGASNELPQGEELGALYDRFPLRYWVEYIQDDINFEGLLSGAVGNSEPTVSITLDEIKSMQDAVKNVPLDDQIIKHLIDLRHKLAKKGIKVSDRRWKVAVRLMQALAYVRGESEVGVEALDILAHVLWDEPEQQKTVKKELIGFADPIKVQVVQWADAAEEIFRMCADNDWDLQAMTQAHNGLTKIRERIKADLSGRTGKTEKMLQDCLDKVSEKLNVIAGKAFDTK